MNIINTYQGFEDFLEASGLKTIYPNVVCFSTYYPGVQDVLGAGIEQLVKFCLLNCKIPILFFSFHPYKEVEHKDKFGLLKLSQIAFIQLPCSKEMILQTAKSQCTKQLSFEDIGWVEFAKKACKNLLEKKIKIIKHNQELAFVNKAGLGLRLSIENIFQYPDQHYTTLKNFNEKYEKMQAYFQSPQIVEIIEFANLIQKSDDEFLNIVYKLVQDFLWMVDENNKEKFNEIRTTIYRIQDSVSELEKLQPK